jgi:nucleolar protein TMA23
MNAHALLTSQGWRGTGHSLHPTSDTTGLSRPLLVSKKSNTLGVGKKSHKTSDMWWMNAFDKSLQGLDTSGEGKVVQTLTDGGLDMVVKGGAKFVGNEGGLYASFVKGECLSGTITPEDDERGNGAQSGNMGSKQRDKTETKETKETKEERRARKAAKRARREVMVEETLVEEEGQIVKRVEKKEERRERKQQKKSLRTAEKWAKETSLDKAKAKKRRKD